MSDILKDITGLPWEWNNFTDVNGEEIESIQQVKGALSVSADGGGRFLLGGTQAHDERVIFYTGNGPTSSANAAYIVHAANNYPALVEALKDIDKHWIDAGWAPPNADASKQEQRVLHPETLAIWRQIRAALAKAGEA